MRLQDGDERGFGIRLPRRFSDRTHFQLNRSGLALPSRRQDETLDDEQGEADNEGDDSEGIEHHVSAETLEAFKGGVAEVMC